VKFSIAPGEVNVYPVGIGRDLRGWWLGTQARQVTIRRIRRSVGRRVAECEWHALKCYLNGYLAEPGDEVSQAGLRRCGRGWTKRQALRSLRRRMRKAGVLAP